MNKVIKSEEIQNLIFTFRNEPVMIDRDLAQLYQVETKVLNQSVKRNINRFPEMFRFQLNDTERIELVTNCDRFEILKHSSVNPYAFTEQGVARSRRFAIGVLRMKKRSRQFVIGLPHEIKNHISLGCATK